MKIRFIAAILCLAVLSSCSQQKIEISRTDFNAGWEFSLNESDWQPVQLPHDWSVSLPFDSIRGEGATGYLLGGMGKYRKTFPSPPLAVTYLYFDGIYNNAKVQLNGKEVGFHPYGYAPFYYDISQAIKPTGGLNELIVEVDRSRYADSRWYTGSGIYREVKLLNEPALHIPPWGISLSTPEVSSTTANIRIETT